MNGGVVGHVVAEVGHWRRENRRKPDGIDAQPLEVVKCAEKAWQVADAVAVAIHERARINLIDNATLPPEEGVIHRTISSAMAQENPGIALGAFALGSRLAVRSF